MDVHELTGKIPSSVTTVLEREGMRTLRPSQEKAIAAGLLTGQSLLICTPTASGKTLIAELLSLRSILEKKRKAIYIVPLVALASEKHRTFTRRWGHLCKVGLAIGDYDKEDVALADQDWIICTSEKLDSLLRHRAPWVKDVDVLVVDEVHLLNDASRGPTLELLLTLLRMIQPQLQLLCLSATIGNPHELAGWLGATLVEDTWRPVELKKGIYVNGKLEFRG